MFKFFFAFGLLLASPAFAQIDWQNLKTGSSTKNWENKLTNISNPNSWDETAFILNEKHSFFGLESEKVELFFYKDRLYRWIMFFDARHWDSLRDVLTSKIDANGKVDENKKEGYWYVEGAKKRFSVFTSDNQMTLYFTDEDPKEFHWKDLFRGSLFYVIITIVGGVILYVVLAWLWVSFCPKCKSLTMEHIRRDTQSKIINTGTFTDELLGGGSVKTRFKNKDTYRCKKCGYKNIYKSED